MAAKVVCPKHGLQDVRYIAADNGLYFDSCLVEEVIAWLVCGCRVDLYIEHEQDDQLLSDAFRAKCSYCGNPFIPDKRGVCSSCGGVPE